MMKLPPWQMALTGVVTFLLLPGYASPDILATPLGVLPNGYAQPDAEDVFLTENNTVVTVHAGSTVTLPCLVQKESQFGIISWARQLKTIYEILTIAEMTHISDQRFIITSNVVNNDWSLKILRIEPDDAGLYKCQANSHPPKFIAVRLNVVEAFADIQGPPERFIKAGSQLLLRCTFHKLTQKPAFTFWYHNSRMINHDRGRGQHLSFGSNSSTLSLPTVLASDSGNYTCAPENATPGHTVVHIEDSNPAAAIHTADDAGPVGGAPRPASAKVVLAAVVAAAGLIAGSSSP